MKRACQASRVLESSIVWSAVKGRPSYDMPGIKAAAVAAGIDLQRYETVGEPSDRLTISITNQTGNRTWQKK